MARRGPHEGSSLSVRQALQRVGGKLAYVEPKSARSRRTIPLPASLVASLRAHRARQLQDRLLAGTRWQESGLVFTTSIGTPLDSRNVTAYFQRLLTRAGLPRMRFHDLRHACASLMLAHGAGPRVIMETLGHSQIGVTMNLYAHVIPSLQRDAADRMEALLTASKA